MHAAAVREAILGELVFVCKRIRVLPVRRARRKDAERLQRALRRYFLKLAKAFPSTAVARRFLGFVGKQEELESNAERVIQEWQTGEGRKITLQLEEIIGKYAADAMVHAAEVIGDKVLRLGVSFKLPRPEAEEFLRVRGAERVRGISEVTRKQLAKVLADGVREGHSIDTIAKRLRETVRDMSKERARLIAWTETGYAYGAAQEKLAQRVGAKYKRWLTAGDDRVCDICKANQEAGKIPVNQPFPGGVMFEIQHPRCKCTTLLEGLP